MEESDKLCRLCGETKPRAINIFDEEGQKLAIDKKIIKCLQIKVLYYLFIYRYRF